MLTFRTQRAAFAHIDNLVSALPMPGGVRTDAGETALIQRQLLQVETEIADVLYPSLKARLFVPLNGKIQAWASSYAFQVRDWAGMAKIIADGDVDDLPTVDSVIAEFLAPIRTLGDAFKYSVQDLISAAHLGMNLDADKGLMARQAMENLIEILTSFGDVASSIPGFLNAANVPVLSAPGSLNGSWLNPSTSAQMMLDDLHDMAQDIVTVSKGVEQPDTIILSTTLYGKISTKSISDLTPADTVLQVFLRTNPYIRGVDFWPMLDTADAAATGPRAVVYKRAAEVVNLVAPLGFTMLPPQAKGLGWTIPCHSRYGGPSIRRPQSMRYVDGLGA